MISTGLSSWQTANGFRLENDVVYGVYNGVGFAVAGEDGGKLFTFMLSGPDNAFDSIEDLLIAQSSRLREVQVGDVENYLALFFEENSGEMPGQLMTDLLDFVLANARSCGFAVPRVCVKCGAPANKRSFYNDMVQPMCASCSEEERLKKRAAAPKQASQPEPKPQPKSEPRPEPKPAADTLLPARSGYNPDEDDTYDQYGPSAPNPNIAPAPRRESAPAAMPLSFADNSADQGSLAKGIFGAVLGAIAGLVPLFLSVMFGLELTVLCAAAGIGAVLGYVAFNGLKRKTTGLATTLTVAEIFSVIAFMAVNIIDGMSEGISFSEALSTSVFAGPIDYINIVIAVITAALGIFVSLDRLADHIADGTDSSYQN